MKSFDEKYPYIAAWVQDGTVEIGYNDYDDVFLRVTDAGGVVWESNKTYSNLDDAFSEMNAGIEAWYRPEQWETLREVSVDRDKLEETYAEWLVDAERVVKQLQQRGLRVIKVDVEISDLMLWCESQRIPLDGEARSNYAAFRVQQLDK